ncbi:hypothetical protein KJ815_02545, partial [bacterium]|nr:hypothetical protein [bacterium]
GGADSDADGQGLDAAWLRCRGEVRSERGGGGYVALTRPAGDTEGFRQVNAALDLPATATRPRVVVGDFQFETGTGLVFASAYGVSNWLSSSDVVAPSLSRGLSVRPSSDRRSLFRGGVLLARRSRVEIALLGSVSQLDAALTDGEAERITEGESYSSAELERARSDQVEERLTGACLQGDTRFARIGIAGYRAMYAPDFAPTADITSPPRLAGDELEVGSLFLSGHVARTELATEWAGSRPGGMAHQSALTIHAERSALTFYHIQADADFFSPRSRIWGGFAEEAANQRTTGVRIGAGWPGQVFTADASAANTPFRTSTSPLSRSSAKFDVRWQWTAPEPVSVELLAGRRWREDASELDPAEGIRVDRGRADVTLRLQNEYRARLEVRSAARDSRSGNSLGTLLFVQTKTEVGRFRVFARVTLFNLEDDDVAMSVYENTVWGAYPIVPLSGSGRRAAVMVSRRWSGVTVSGKLAHGYNMSSTGRNDALEMALELAYRR